MTLTAEEAYDGLQDEREVKELIKLLVKRGYLKKREYFFTWEMSIGDWEMESACNKIVNGRLQLSNEDEDLVKSIANKL